MDGTWLEELGIIKSANLVARGLGHHLDVTFRRCGCVQSPAYGWQKSPGWLSESGAARDKGECMDSARVHANNKGIDCNPGRRMRMEPGMGEWTVR